MCLFAAGFPLKPLPPVMCKRQHSVIDAKELDHLLMQALQESGKGRVDVNDR